MRFAAADVIKTRVPRRARKRLIRRWVAARELTSAWRPMPAFLIIGAQRGGTSSLYKYLEAHPDLAASVRKETEYFSRRFERGESWYRAHFPLTRRRLPFEATPDYLFYPPTPARVASRLPDTRLIVLLRDPVQRAYSHYRHMVRLGFETLGLEEALAKEPERIAADVAALAEDPMHRSRDLLLFSYAARGLYAEQLERWLLMFDRSQILILRSEDLFADAAATLGEIYPFLGVRPTFPADLRNHSYGVEPELAPMPADVARHLGESLADDVRRLEGLLGRSMGWPLDGGGSER